MIWNMVIIIYGWYFYIDMWMLMIWIHNDLLVVLFLGLGLELQYIQMPTLFYIIFFEKIETNKSVNGNNGF